MTDPILPPVLVTPPTAWPVSIFDLRNHLRIEDGEQDGELSQVLAAAHAYCDGWEGCLGLCIASQVWDQPFAAFDQSGLRLALRPLKSIDAITYRDVDGVEQTLSPSAYRREDEGAQALVLPAAGTTWPRTSTAYRTAVRVRATFGPAQSCPPTVKQIILLLAAHWFENRSASAFGGGFGQLPIGVEALVQNQKRLVL